MQNITRYIPGLAHTNLTLSIVPVSQGTTPIMATKLARQMALKKKLEDEYKQANERLNDRLSLSGPRKYFPMSFDLSSDLRYKPLETRPRNKIILEEEPSIQEVPQLNEIIEKEDEEAQRRLQAEEEERRRREEDERQRLEEEDRKVREAEEEQKIIEEKKRKEMARRRKAERRRIEMNEIRESRKLMINEDAKLDKEVEKVKLDEEQIEEMRKTEDRIKELELSIATLDMDLERFDLERMRSKTLKVKKRMSLVINDREEEEEEVDMILAAPTVRGFIQNDRLWGKYLRRGSVA